jgi:CCR4-NOT transcriptional complex subunit CAF120
MATAASSTPQWDSRNRGFISPGQLQQLRQSSPLAREFNSSERPRSMTTDPFSSSSPHRPSSSATSNHSRSSSFFAFLKSNDNPPSTVPSRAVEPGLQRQVSSDEHGRLALEKRGLPQPSSSTLDRSPSLAVAAQPQAMQLHPEIRSVVNLTHAHAHKIYMSGPLVRRIERLPDGHHPIKDEGWRDVWAQLGGTTLSVWDMKEIEEASKLGREVPPTYINVTDAVGLIFLPHIPLSSNCYISLCKSSGLSPFLPRVLPPHQNTITLSPSTRQGPILSFSLVQTQLLSYLGLQPSDWLRGRNHALRRSTLLILSASP